MGRVRGTGTERIDPQASLARFRALGLDGNPFRELGRRTLEAWVVGRGPDPDAILSSSAPCVQIVGAPGRGKSTLLCAIARRVEESGQRSSSRFLPPDHDGSFPPPDADVGVACIDEAQRLDRSGVRAACEWLDEGERRLVLATHADLSRVLSRATTTFELKAVSAEEVLRVFEARILAAGGSQERFELTKGAARRLASEAKGTIRGVVERLHGVFESLAADLARVVIDERRVKRGATHR